MKPARLTIKSVVEQRAPRIMLVRYCDYMRLQGLEPAATSPDEVVFEVPYASASHCPRWDSS